MRIAVAYGQDGNVFHHFGQCEAFKFYDAEEDEILSSEVVETGGARGHIIMADILAQHDTEVLLCDGLGVEALIALARRNIEVVPGIQGSADKSVKAYLNGTLEPTGDGITCDCGSSECGEEGHSCDGNCSHCNPFGGAVR